MIPEGFKKTRWDFTLEKTDLSKPSPGQKAPKRFFCSKCMKKDVLTGYTKRNDLSIHLQSCGKEKEKKFKCDYKDCKASYVRSDNLKQHIAKEHTKKILYTCKKCDKGFYTSPEATAHRKICYPEKPDDDHTVEDIPKDEDENGKNKTVEVEDEDKGKGEVEGEDVQDADQ